MDHDAKRSRQVRMLCFSASSGLIVPICLVAMLILSSGCSTQKMSVEEAKSISVSTSKRSMDLPPRRVDDIINILTHYTEKDTSKANEYRKILAAPPPRNASDNEMAIYYQKKAQTAAFAGDNESCLKYIRTAYEYDKKDGNISLLILWQAAFYEDWIGGNFQTGIALYRRALGLTSNPGIYREVVQSYLRRGDIVSAEKVANDGMRIFSASNDNFTRICKASISALMLDAAGRFDDAGEEWLKANSRIEEFRDNIYLYYITKRNYIYNLMYRHMYSSAEIETRKLLQETIETRGKDSTACAQTLGQYAEVLLHQGRPEQAELLAKIALKTRSKWNIEKDIFAIDIHRVLVDTFAAKREFLEAAEYYDLSKNLFDQEGYIFNRYYMGNNNLPIVLLFSERKSEADHLIGSFYKSYYEKLGENHVDTIELQLLRGISQTLSGKYIEGYSDYQACIDRFLAARSEYFVSFSKRQRFRVILEAYLKFFSEIHKTPREAELCIDASLEAFKIVEVLRQQSVQQALSSSAARMAVQNADLSLLVRQEQDNERMIAVLDRMLINHVSMAPDQQDPKVVEDLKQRIAGLSAARTTLLAEIRQRFPDYEKLTNPQPADYQAAARLLRPHEALLSIYPSAERSYLWALDGAGRVDFVVLPVGSRELTGRVQELRRSLELGCDRLGDIPELDLKLSHWFYQTFLEPVRARWAGKKDVVVVADGPLGALPFAVLTTGAHTRTASADVMFGDYRKVPWLVRQVAVTRLPSIGALIGLRSLPPGDPSRKAFVGFGDPIFHPAQAKADSSAAVAATVAQRGAEFQIRGVRVTQMGAIDQANMVSNRLNMLNRLPDTAEEVLSVGQSLKADTQQDVFLGPKASEQTVRSLDLSNRRVVYFATHALVPGDIDGLHEPALALSTPEVAGGDEDGLLTAGEIMTLKLNADWVILSACNTAAAGEGAEAISGLGRAFFYAGTRALLVSQWPVETSSARELTTRLFEAQSADPGLSRSAALQSAMLQLIDGPGMLDAASGKTIASYAHPFFWAPFVIVGDNGGPRTH